MNEKEMETKKVQTSSIGQTQRGKIDYTIKQLLLIK
jgi:hypothetical protein